MRFAGALGRRYLGYKAALALFAASSALSAGFAQAQAQTSAPTSNAERAFSILAGPLSAALVAFGRQAGIQISYVPSIASGLTTAGVSGLLTPNAALAQLLAGSKLSYRFTGARTVLIEQPGSGPVTGAAPAGAIPLDTIDVQGGDGDGTAGYVATRSVAGTKTSTPLIETPQSISVVARKQMDDQNVQNVPEALRYTSGVLPEQRGVSETGLEYLYGRGFLMDTYLDGLRLPSANTGSTGYNVVAVDPYFLQSIQVLHGPASVLYGQASPGGVVDLVSKQPAAEPLHEIFLQTGSYGRIQSGFDIGGPVDQSGQFLYRLTGEGLNTGTQVDHVNNQRVAIAPSVTWRPDNDTKLTVQANYQYDPEAGFYNFVPAVGTVLPNINGKIPLNLDPGDSSLDRHSRTQESFGYQFEHRFDNIFTVRQNFRYLTVDDNLKNVFGNGLAANQTTLNRYSFVNDENLNYLTIDNQLQADISTWMLQHTILVGLDYARTTGTEAYGLGAAPGLNVFAPVYGMNIATPAYSGIEHIGQDRLGLYAQDQIKIGGLRLLIGGRQDWYSATDHELISDSTQLQNDHPFTWRTGAVYEFDNGIAPYVSYATSFQPDESTTYTYALLPPTTAQQYEGGIKYQPAGSRSFVTAAVFDLTEQNVATTDPNHQNFSIATGEIRSRGLELEGHSNLTDNIELIGAYTYNDALVTQSTTTNLGKVPTGIPKNMASLWGTYRFTTGALTGLQLGAGVRYVGSSWGTTTNTFEVPDYTLVDLAVQYDLGTLTPTLKNYQASINATNLFNKEYVASCASLTNCNFGLGRTVLAKLVYRW
ncbi:TonB-dependent siderophore receptor [Bradyrhizobium sp. dw_78]|uniref:TonB-dependent siderophore receptor n=1 Tax=Bradyrhizobium sp. dw_78 TaxID=2719793 RepID=UPI001BD43507|nr:TonB-dependent siderophore receptor [Bradyrhizobium sp. dw_78]